MHDSLARPAARTLPALQSACYALWPRFTAPIRAGYLSPRDFSRLVIAARLHFQDETLLCPSIIATQPGHASTSPSAAPITSTTTTTTTPSSTPKKAVPATVPTPSIVATPSTTPELAMLLPRTARLILLASYLASHNTARHDLTLFSTYHHGKRRRRGGGGGALASTQSTPRGRAHSIAGKRRKVARRLLGAQAFVLERMMAIFAAVRSEWVGGAEGGDVDGDVVMAVATLASLRLLVRVGVSGDVMDRAGKWRVNVGWDMVRALGRSMGVEMEDWLIE